MRPRRAVAVLGLCGALGGCSLAIDTSGLYGGAVQDRPDASEDGSTTTSDAAADARDVDREEASADVPVLARDAFERVVQAGLGVAEIGGSWTAGGSASSASFSVTGGAARMGILKAGAGMVAKLPSVATDDADLQIVLSSDKLGSGSGLYLTVLGRGSGSNGYQTQLRLDGTGRVNVQLLRQFETVETELARVENVLTLSPNEQVRVRLQVFGRSPTRIRSKVWKAADVEPPSWLAEAADTTPALQMEGFVGVETYLSSSATNAPLTVSLDDLLVRPATRVP
jgi:hypothetical protein